MKAYEIREGFGIDSLALADRPQPRPTSGEVLIKVKAVSLNYRDLLVMTGAYSNNLPLPLIPCSDGAGEVAEIGEGVTRVVVGQRVAGIFLQSWLAGDLARARPRSALGGDVNGMLAEFVALSEEGVVRIPEHLSYEEGATLPCAAVTAWNALITQGRLQPGNSVLVLGTGGVSIFALQFAKLAGARVIATSSRDAKIQRLLELGASEAINYKTTPDWDARVRQLTGIGVDHVVEVGGAGTLPKSLRAVRPGGVVSLIGVLAGAGEFNPVLVLMKGVRLQGISVGSREMFEAMNQAVSLHQLHPVIDRIFPFAQAREALHYMESGAHFGKIVIRV